MKLIGAIFSLIIIFSQSQIDTVSVSKGLTKSVVVISANKVKIAYMIKDSATNKDKINIYDIKQKAISTTITDVSKPSFGYNLTSLMNDKYICWLEKSEKDNSNNLFYYDFSSGTKFKVENHKAFYDKVELIDYYITWIECNLDNGWCLYYIDVRDTTAPILIKKLTDNTSIPKYLSTFTYNDKPYLLFTDSFESGSGIGYFDFENQKITPIADTDKIETHPAFLNGKIYYIEFSKTDPVKNPVEDFSFSSAMYCFDLSTTETSQIRSFEDNSYPRILTNKYNKSTLLFCYMNKSNIGYYYFNSIAKTSSLIISTSNLIKSISIHPNSCSDDTVLYKTDSTDEIQSIYSYNIQDNQHNKLINISSSLDFLYSPGQVLGGMAVIYGHRKKDENTGKYKIVDIELSILSFQNLP